MQLAILIPLALMILSDYKSRTVLLWQLLLFGVMVLTISLVKNGVVPTLTNTAINVAVSLMIGLCVYLYFWLRCKSVRSVIGKGDILFILFLTPFFTPRLYLIFMVVSFVATLLMWGIYLLAGKRSANIPLISGVGMCLCVLLIYLQITQWLP